VHTDVDRWWVIMQPTNLYAQEQFPNMDLALTFHVGYACAYHAVSASSCPSFRSSRSPSASATCAKRPTP
jgi:hypothetical protein